MKNDHGLVLLTRFRWDCYMIPALLVAISIGWRFGQFVSAFELTALWGFLRYSTPAKGISVPTIRATPGMEAVLWNSALLLGSLLAVAIIDMTILGARFNAPLKPYHILLFCPSMILFLVNVRRAELAHRKLKQDRIERSGSCQ